MFSKYAAVVKNLRGVVLLDVHEARIEEAVVWLTQRFRYRNLGVPPSLLMRGPEFFTKYAGKPFVELAYPVKSLEKLANLVESELGAEKTAAEVSVLASAYVSPILALGERGPKLLEPLGADRVESKIEPSLRDLKLHLRIADYSVLDLYQWSVENAKQLWRKNPGDLVKERAERITRDKKRYWRLQRGSRKPTDFLLYIDLVQKAAENSSFLKRLLTLPPQEVSAGLAIVTAVILRGFKGSTEESLG
ncbi:MAG: hypothetical protein QXK27_00935 [Candidatus Hadarchaeales archaeon]